MEQLESRTHEFHHPDLDALHEEVLDTMALARYEGTERGYLNMATGTGKTEIAARDVQAFLKDKPDAKVLFLCHDTNVLEQATDTFASVLGSEVSQGRIFGGQIEHDAQVTFASFHQLNRSVGPEQRLYELMPPDHYDYVVVDESHHGPAETYSRVIKHLSPEFLLGLTATPERSDQQEIEELFGDPLYTLLLEEAIAKGYLAKVDYRVLSDRVRDLKEIETDLGAIKPADLNSKIFIKRRDGEIADMIAEHLYKVDDPKTIVFCPSIEYANYISDFLPGNVAPLHSGIPKDERNNRLKMFREGQLDILTVVDQLNEGVDVPDANVVVFLRPTQSRTVFLQQLGRGLRKYFGKDEVLVLDFVSSWEHIKDIQKLEEDVYDRLQERSARERRGEPGLMPTKARQRTNSAFKFEFSEEALHAIDIITKVRGARKRVKKVTPKPRVENWQAFDAAIIDMMGLTRLPEQRMAAKDWVHYSQRIANGDSRAKEELLMRRLRSIYSAVKTYHDKTEQADITIEDYFQEAVAGFLSALDSYNPENHKSLKNVIDLAVFQSLGRTSRGSGIVRAPDPKAERSIRLDNARESLRGADATDAGIADATGVKESEVRSYTQFHRNLAYTALLELAANKNESLEKGDDSTTHDIVAERERRLQLRAVLSEFLSYRERRILELRYGLEGEEPKNLDEVGRTFNVTRERVRQIETNAFKKLYEFEEMRSLSQASLDKIDKQATAKSERERYNEAHERQLHRKQSEANLAERFGYRRDDQTKQEWTTEVLGRLIVETIDKQDRRDGWVVERSYRSIDRVIQKTRFAMQYSYAFDDQEFTRAINRLIRTGQIKMDGRIGVSIKLPDGRWQA